MDRGYVDFARLHRFTRAQASFVVRAKKNLRFQRRYSREVDRSTGLVGDQTVMLVTPRSLEGYPSPCGASAHATRGRVSASPC
jgi:hypothetical protein